MLSVICSKSIGLPPCVHAWRSFCWESSCFPESVLTAAAIAAVCQNTASASSPRTASSASSLGLHPLQAALGLHPLVTFVCVLTEQSASTGLTNTASLAELTKFCK